MSEIRPEQLLNQPVPDLAPLDPDGRPWPLRSAVGRSPLVLFFYTHNCSPGCLQELREFAAHRDEFAAAGIPLVGISLDPPESNRAFLEKSGMGIPLLSDADRACGNAFGVRRQIGIAGWQVEFHLRASFLVDAHGIVAGVWPKFRANVLARELLDAANALRRYGDSATAGAPGA